MIHKLKLKNFYPLLGSIYLLSTFSNLVAQQTITNWKIIGTNNTREVPAKSMPDYFQLEQDNDMVKYKTYTDEQGNVHERYYQTYKGYRVDEGNYILHYRNNGLTAMNGSIVEGLVLNTDQRISENDAIRLVLDIIPELRNNEHTYNITKPASPYPIDQDELFQGTLVVTGINDELTKNKTYHLVYRFVLKIPALNFSKTYTVDASTGEILSSISNKRNCNLGTGSGTTFYNGTQSFKTQWTGSLGRYKLFDDCRKIDTYELDPNGNIHNIKDWDNDWTDSDDREGVSAHWAMQRAFDYFEYAYNLTGPDGWYQQVNVFTKHTPGDIYWDNDEIYIGEEDGTYNSFTPLDMCGHEWTHGVNVHQSGILYEDESGALDESFGDIFGAMVEYYVEGFHSGTYLQGDDAGTRRNLANPAQYNQPSIYQGTFWQDYNTDPSDHGGVHINSGVQNHWFYLLAEGGSQTVGGTTYNVTGIGIENAAYVAYKNVRDYIFANAQYADAKNGAIMAAIDIWGVCDWKTEQVINAWNAVGVSSVNGFNYNENINCNVVNFVHASGNTYYNMTLNNMTSNCTYAANNTTRLTAGNEIKLLPGSFIGSGDFVAHITPCLDNNMRVSSIPTNYAGIGNTAIETDVEESISLGTTNPHRIYPNPSTGAINIDFLITNNNHLVEIINLMGEVIRSQQNFGRNRLTFDLSDQPKGIYLVKIITNNQTHLEKVLIQ